MHKVPGSRLTAIVTAVAVLGILYVARDLLMPVALAALVSFMLQPLVLRLQHWIGRVVAVVAVVVLLCGAVGGVGWLVAGQFTELARMLPQYRDNIVEKLGALQVGALERAKEAVKEIEEDVQEQREQKREAEAQQQPEPAREEAPPAAREPKPMKVQVVPEEPTALQVVAGAFGPLLGPLGTAGIVVLLVVFMLLAHQDLRDRTIRLFGRGRIRVTTQAMDEAARRVSRYLLMQATINALTGIVVGVGLFMLDVPGYFLWGLLSALLRFVPYVGPWIAAAMPVAISLAVFDGWAQPLAVIGYFVVVELVSNNVLEPWLYGNSAGVSPLAVIVMALTWTWLWGPIGLLLAMPMTVCLVVMGKHVPPLRFLPVLLGDEPVLEPHARLYQRLVGRNLDEAGEIAEQHFEEHGSLAKTYDEVVLPALALAAEDREVGALDDDRGRYVEVALREIVGDVALLAVQDTRRKRERRQARAEARARKDAAAAPARPPAEPLPGLPSDLRVAVVAAHDAADEIAGEMVAQLVRACGGACETTAAPARAAGVEAVHLQAAHAVVISAVPPSAVSHARRALHALRAALPELPVVVGLWTKAGTFDAVRDRLDAGDETTFAATMRDAIAGLARIEPAPLGTAPEAPEAPEAPAADQRGARRV